jgi:hypothetical protein
MSAHTQPVGNQWKVWREFFETVDDMEEGDSRSEYMELIARQFAAAGNPTTWLGYAFVKPELQRRLTSEYKRWEERN